MRRLVVPLFTLFLNSAGVAVAFAFLNTLLFDSNLGIVGEGMGAEMRGLLYGAIVAAYTFMPFLFSSFTGSLSDQIGRRKVLLPTLGLNAFSFFLCAFAVFIKCWPLFLLSRAFAGISASNTAVAQAIISDISTPETKRKNFGLTSVAGGLGFTLAPFISGYLALYSLTLPFFVFSAFSFCTFLYTYFFFDETHNPKGRQPLNPLKGFLDLKKVLKIPSLSTFFVSMVILFFGWETFFPFASLFLKERFSFSMSEVTLFYGLSGILFGVGGIFLRIFERIPLHRTIQFSILLFGLMLYGLYYVHNAHIFWFYVIPLMVMTPTFFAGAVTYVSGFSDGEHQGEILGIYNSFQQFALTIPPLVVGPLLPKYPTLVVTAASFCALLAVVPSLFLKESLIKSRS